MVSHTYTDNLSCKLLSGKLITKDTSVYRLNIRHKMRNVFFSFHGSGFSSHVKYLEPSSKDWYHSD